jgi:CDP-paratose 2-epimerase
VSLSLLETTELCRELTGNEVPVEATDEQRPGDVPVYISDWRRLEAMTDWRPQRDARAVLMDILAWVQEHEEAVVRAAI